ncbi:hypothetical protein [Halobacillus sp. A5]|uniref:hypothetical protein n=1 Tax=Halobacillus sp. A5 TaxID=2880263 RepID=UPI0020A6B746|nr:hypothetical protein [Halobacillus sp. A5]MCP3029622.1 hypothetical protein [Halobacillus sp. A5]
MKKKISHFLLAFAFTISIGLPEISGFPNLPDPPHKPDNDDFPEANSIDERRDTIQIQI